MGVVPTACLLVSWDLQTVEASWPEAEGHHLSHEQPDAVDPDQSFRTVLRETENSGMMVEGIIPAEEGGGWRKGDGDPSLGASPGNRYSC